MVSFLKLIVLEPHLFLTYLKEHVNKQFLLRVGVGKGEELFKVRAFPANYSRP